MARYQVILAYDGAGFQGSQRQAESRTVQGELEKSLRKLGWSETSALMAGRTDRGAHATGQVAAFDFEWTHSAERLLKALNADLPPDLAIQSLTETSADFHPRFDAVARRYVYKLFCDPIRNPLREKLAWRVWPAIDEKALQLTADIFLGTHDFASFGSRTTPHGTTVRQVTKAEWKKKPDGEWQFQVQADAFLFRMVRRMVFIQIAVAQGRCSPEDVQKAVSRQKTLLSGLAPAHGLTLVEVTYGSH
ncbi:MAG: tRNA pseudouridine(38-40) synthase TruA [Anaerolineales bacterium]|nr:tRNA pseudouridine(38-40) synthase TruA [Anaerolineales bacterium]